jgi:sodium/potassium-transporting ATPase subunit alpha
LIDYTRAGQAVFGTAPIGLAAWLAVVPFAVTMLIAEEGRKAIVRASERRGRETARVVSAT